MGCRLVNEYHCLKRSDMKCLGEDCSQYRPSPAPEGENPWTKYHEQDDIEDQVLPLGHAIDMKRLGWSTEFGFVIGNDFPSAWGVTHWMPLPKPPEAWNRRSR